MPALALNHLEVFPSWLQIALPNSVGILAMIILIVLSIGKLRDPKLIAFFAAAFKAAKHIGIVLQRQIKPVKSKRILRALGYGTVALCYSMSGYLLVLFTGITILWGITPKHLTLVEHAEVISYCLLCAYIAGVLRTQGTDELDKLRGR